VERLVRWAGGSEELPGSAGDVPLTSAVLADGPMWFTAKPRMQPETRRFAPQGETIHGWDASFRRRRTIHVRGADRVHRLGLSGESALQRYFTPSDIQFDSVVVDEANGTLDIDEPVGATISRVGRACRKKVVYEATMFEPSTGLNRCASASAG